MMVSYTCTIVRLVTVILCVADELDLIMNKETNICAGFRLYSKKPRKKIKFASLTQPSDDTS